MINSKLLIVHGANLYLYKDSNDLSIVETQVNPYLEEHSPTAEIIQTNYLSEVIDILASNPELYTGMIINVDYEITCTALANTIKLLDIPTVEVNTRLNKEGSSLREVTKLEIAGDLTLDNYKLAISYFDQVTDQSTEV